MNTWRGMLNECLWNKKITTFLSVGPQSCEMAEEQDRKKKNNPKYNRSKCFINSKTLS